ncbi:metal-dependent hydrolase [Patescibacteria group bacterium]
MTTITHICTGYLISQGLIVTGIVPSEIGHQITAVSIVTANFPDIDIIGTIKKKNLMMHRESRMHTPIYWLIAFILFISIFSYFNLTTLLTFSLISLVNIIMHFIMDTYTPDSGIKWLAPFSNKEFGPLVMDIKPDSIYEALKSYIKAPVFKYEFVFWVGTLIIKSKFF